MQPAATVARPRSCRQSKISLSVCGINGSCGGMTWLLVVRTIVRERRVFLAQGRDVSNSRRWALVRIERRRTIQPRIWWETMPLSSFGSDCWISCS